VNDTPSSSPEITADAESSAFEQLHEKVRRWIWQQGWTELRDIQERSIPILLDGKRDLIIAAGTASGKTEAAFLPIVSRLAWDERPPGAGFEALYVSPLRALINDQFGRIETLCEEIGLPVTKWHGDVAASVKARARKNPHGILLTTPESLEAILVRRGPEAARLFAALNYVVVDEMHAFMDSERGRQLQSLLNRLEIAAGRRVARVGLSATLADMRTSAAFLRPLAPGAVDILESKIGGQELRLQVRGYIEPHLKRGRGRGDEAPEDPAFNHIIRHLFETLRGHRSLIFAGSRQRVELVTAELSGLCEALGVPEEFFAHHGSLSREHREEAERRLKQDDRPGSIVATTTLELGIDVGHIEAVAQIGPGHTVSGMRQRLGRSGRRAGHASVMRVYVTEMALDERTSPLDAMRPSTVQAVAMLNLMLRRWNEPQQLGRLHLSTLVQQILALIAQHGGLTAAQGWRRLVESGVFPAIDQPLYLDVLRRMGDPEVKLVEQAPDGTLLPGEEGERVINDRGFYAVFMSPDEFRVVTDRGKSLGSLPVDNPVIAEQLIIFAGRRWKVLEVDPRRKEILVTRAHGGKPPAFGGDGLPPHDEVVAEMRRVYEGITIPPFLDAAAVVLLTEARETFDRLGLRHASVRRNEDDLLLFPWVGNRAQMAFILALAAHGVMAASSGIAVVVPGKSQPTLRKILETLAANPPPDAVALARMVPDMKRSKYDAYLGDNLLARCYASERIDSARIPLIAADLLSRMQFPRYRNSPEVGEP
jgi:ATP-dependent helicase Lhr and Lhr-like helicase